MNESVVVGNNERELINSNSWGSLSVIVGCMMSQKTTELLRRLTLYADLGESVLLINHIFDDRDHNNLISSHSSQYKGPSDKIKVVKTDKLTNINKEILDEYDVIGIEEAQFFDDLYDGCVNLLQMKKAIIVVGLDGDFRRNNFGEIHKLLPISDEFYKMKSKCNFCCNISKKLNIRSVIDAPFTLRLSDDSDLISVGGSDKYVPVCRYHYDMYSK